MKTCSPPVSLRNKAQSAFEVNLKLTCLLRTRLDSCTHVHPLLAVRVSLWQVIAGSPWK